MGAHGQRLFDEPLGGFTAECQRILEVMVLKLGLSVPEQCHDVLSLFLETMLLRKIGRALLEKHKSDVCAMLTLYFHHYLIPPNDDLARPRIGIPLKRIGDGGLKARILYLPESKVMGSRGGNERVPRASRIDSNGPTTLQSETVGSGVQPCTVLAAVSQSSTNGGHTGKVVERTLDTIPDATADMSSSGIAGAGCSSISVAQTPTPYACAAVEDVIGHQIFVGPVPPIAPVFTNAGNKRSAESADLSEDGGPARTRRKSDTPKTPPQVVVIDLLDSDDEYEMPMAHLLLGHKKKPIAID
ncbi:hypothetical protein FKW77_008903 [Venturia effusa]|uniref:Uncharacterized protein n=1 Tax=Venturia effusa TaxID=50376 RepID=A0A517KX43_9PEZI|nr:hypothetical protein FKW77_008903 [Venturia effusa]